MSYSTPNSPAFGRSLSGSPDSFAKQLQDESSAPFSSEVPLELPLSPFPSLHPRSPRSHSRSPSFKRVKRAASPSAQPVSTYASLNSANAQPRAVYPVSSPTYAPVAAQSDKLYAYDRVFPTAFQLDGRMSSQVINWTFDFPDVFAGIHPGISKLFALLQFNSRTPTTSRRTPRWYLRGNQWLVGFNKKDFELPENQQMFGKALDTLYQELTGRSKKDKEDKKPYLVKVRNYLGHSPHPEFQQMQASAMAFFWRQDFFPNCSLVHLRNVSIPIHHEESCKVSMAPTMLVLDIPDWYSSVNSVNSTPLETQSQAVDEEDVSSDSSDTEAQNSEGNIGTDPVSGEPGFYCVECRKIGIKSFIYGGSTCRHSFPCNTFLTSNK